MIETIKAFLLMLWVNRMFYECNDLFFLIIMAFISTFDNYNFIQKFFLKPVLNVFVFTIFFYKSIFYFVCLNQVPAYYFILFAISFLFMFFLLVLILPSILLIITCYLFFKCIKYSRKHFNSCCIILFLCRPDL